MGVEITFHYEAEAATTFEVEEVTSEGFVSLFDCDAEVLKKWNLWPTFIAEYRQHNEDDIEWQSIEPFTPQEARTWAQRGINFIEQSNPDEWPELFPYQVNMTTGESTFDKDWTIEDLEKLIQQAECAERHSALMTVEALWG